MTENNTMRRSALGSYAGFTEPVANGYVRSSQYVAVRDGCLLAVDMLHPARDGVPLGGRRPSVMRGTGYRRAFRRTERIAYDVSRIPIIEQYPIGAVITPYEIAPVAKRLVDHGYVFVSVDVRGTGASFGEYDQPATLQTGRDLADVIDWLVAQDWSDGKVGMWGRSWEAAVQLVTAIAGTPNLTCICPMAIGSQVESTWFNGMFAIGFRWPYNALRKAMELDEIAMPVDGPDGERLRREALANRPTYFPWPTPEALGEAFRHGKYATDWRARMRSIGIADDPALGRPPLPVEQAAAINACGAAVYWLDGWWDLNFINSAIGLYNALDVPKKMTIGPWTHSQFAMAHEPHRWFDFWLKGIDNGIMSEPPLQYSVSSADGATIWRGTRGLPVAEAVAKTLYLSAREGGDARHDGLLVQSADASGADAPGADAPGVLHYVTDYDTSTGPQTRTSYLWRSVQLHYGDLQHRVGRCLTFTGAPLDAPIELTGVASLRMQVTASGSPAALFVTLEDVHPDGHSDYLTEGVLNLEYRARLPAPAGCLTDATTPIVPELRQEIVPGQPMAIVMDLLAVGVRLAAGHRLRVSLAGADRENYYLPACDPPVAFSIAIGGANGARIELPVVAPDRAPPALAGTFQDDALPFAFEPRLRD